MNANDQLELSAGTLRQRRNLFVVAIILIMIRHAEITFGDSFQLQGISLKIGNPWKLHQLLYIGLVYFAWRYYQYFSTDKAYAYVKAQYRELRDGILNRAVVKEIFRAYPVIALLSGEYEYKKLESDGRYYYKITATAARTHEIHSGSFEVRIAKIRIEFRRVIAASIFFLRGRILTDYYLPFLIAAYALSLYFV